MLKRIFTALSVSLIAISSIISLTLDPAVFPAFAQEETSVESVSSPTETPQPSEEPAPVPSVEVTPTPTPSEETQQGTVAAVILPDTSTQTLQLDLGTNNEITSASLTTDKADYAPTDSALISGSGLKPNTTYIIVISSTDPPAVTKQDNVTTDDKGSFIYAYQLDGISRPLYTVEVKDAVGNVVATTTFTDPPPPSGPAGTDFSQCSNKNPTARSCKWIGSIVQSSNSVYFEGMTVPQRLLFRDTQIADGTHHITFTYQYTKAGIHAYDFLTTVNPTTPTVQGNTPPETLHPCANLGGTDTTACTALNPSINSPTAQITVPGDSFNSKDSAPLLGAGTSQTTKESNYETANGGAGSRKITVYASIGVGFSSPLMTLTHSPATADSDTGDTTVAVDITFTSSGCSTGSGCNYLLYFGGHLALTGADNTTGSNWGPGLGSSQISGGPYHIKSVKFDGSGGSLDNQIKGADILVQQGTIELKKIWSGTGGQTTLNIGTTADASDVDTQPTGSNGGVPLTTGQNTVNADTYFVSETGGLTNYNSSLSCFNDVNDNGANDSEPAVTVGGSNSVAVGSGEHVICTFTNTRKQGKIELQKDFVGTPESVTIRIGTSQNGTQVDLDVLSADGTDGEHTVNTGNYFVSEVLTTPANYTTGLACYNDLDNSNTVNGGDTTHTVNTGTGAVSVGVSDDVICVFTNTRNTGTLRVLKNVDLNGDGDYDDADETGAIDWLWQANGGSDHNTGDSAITVDTGDFALTETSKTDFHKVGLSCEGGTLVGNTVTVAKDANVVCTFTNARDTGSLLVHKLVDTDANGSFETTDTGANTLGFRWGLDAVSPARNMGSTASGVLTGSHDVNENSITNYHFVGWFDNAGQGSCDEPDSSTLPASVSVSKDATTTITLCNAHDTGTIELKKVWSGTGGQTTLNIGTSNGGTQVDTQLTGAAGVAPLTTDPNTVVTGNYFVSETGGLDNYNSLLACEDQDGVVTVGADNAVNVEKDDAVICTFTNTRKQGSIELVKKWVGTANDVILNIGSTQGGSEVDTETLDSSDGTTGENKVDTGTYYVSEEGSDLAHYETDLDCVNAADNDAPVTVGAGSSVPVNENDQVVCTYTNTEHGHIIVDKVTDPSGDTKSFHFPTQGTGYNPFDLTDLADPNDQEVVAGTYIVGEDVPAGWKLTHKECIYDSQSVGVAIPNGEQVTIDPGDTVRCTFTNTKEGSLKIIKDAQPNDAQDFTFNTSNLTPTSFVLDDDPTSDPTPPNNWLFDHLLTGTYGASETLPSSLWKLDSINCINAGTTDPYTDITKSTTGVSVNLTAGKNVECTFVNIKQRATRTLGFWQTHTVYTTSVFNAAPLIGSMLIGNGGTHKGPVNTINKIFGVFYSSIPYKTTLVKRDPIDKARMQLLQQLVAAKLNCAAFECSASTLALITTADGHYATGTAAQILADASLLDTFNNSGEGVPVSGTGFSTPLVSQLLANRVFWDSP